MEKEIDRSSDIEKTTAEEVELNTSNTSEKRDIRYKRKVESTVTEINNELNKILSSGTTIKGIDNLESDMAILIKKSNELRKAMNGGKKEPKIYSPSAAKIYRAMDKLIEISLRYDIDENDKKAILNELRGNLGETSNFVALVKKALKKPDEFAL
ncbi:hypothetical protein QTV49_000383 [Vibrio vulnificus]|nr:hypothetical protein [Vibrio vulnificus]